MKKSPLVFMFSCFYVFMFSSCASHELETPESPLPTDGKIDSPKIDFKKEVENALTASPPYAFSYGNIPLAWIWANINYKSFDYKKFFVANCPGNPKNDANQMDCNYESVNSKRFFSINVYDGRIVVNIKEIYSKNYFLSQRLEGIWEITGSEDDFTVVKYEKITNDERPADYAKIQARYIAAEKHIIASGASSSYLSGSFTFETDEIRFTTCLEKPDGYIYIYGTNTVGVNFYQTKNCFSCAPAAFDGQYGKYDYCGPWPLRDLFDYLKPFLPSTSSVSNDN